MKRPLISAGPGFSARADGDGKQISGRGMVTMIMNLLAVEQDIQQIHDYMEHIAADFQGFDNNPAVVSLRDHLKMLQVRQQEAINQWPQLGADATL